MLKSMSLRDKPHLKKNQIAEDASSRKVKSLMSSIATYSNRVAREMLSKNSSAEIIPMQSALMLLTQAQILASTNERDARKLFSTARRMTNFNVDDNTER